MAHLNKQQYDYRRESAASKAASNESMAVSNGMTAEQAELISSLCSLRHELHTNMDAVTKDDADAKIKQSLVNVNADIKASGLAPMSFIPSDKEDYLDIDSIAELQDMGMMDDYDEEYERIYHELEELNHKIESYLADIDSKFGTSFCPSGLLRIM